MTVCIAAISDLHSGQPKIILCSDGRGSSIVGAADTSFKQHYLDHQWLAMASGNESEINAVIRTLHSHFKDKEGLTAPNFDRTVKGALAARRKEKCDTLTQSRFSVSYDDFLRIGKEKFDAGIFRDAQSELSLISVDVSLIFVGWIDGQPEIYKTDGNLGAWPVTDFAVIGEGEYLATASLIERGYAASTALSKAVYFVYEAKRSAERVVSVGPTAALNVVYGPTASRGRAHGVGLMDHFAPGLKSLYDEIGTRKWPLEADLAAAFPDQLREDYEEGNDGSGDSEAER